MISPCNMALDATLAMDRCEDFVNETTLLEELFRPRAHIFVYSVKCHQKLAGCGIEYSWGKLKLCYRRNNTRLGVDKEKTVQERVQVLIPEALPIQRVWKFECKARDYRRMYVDLQEKIANNTFDKENITFASIQQMVKVMESHRNIVELCVDYLDETN
jgi:hypothetical protein